MNRHRNPRAQGSPIKRVIKAAVVFLTAMGPGARAEQEIPFHSDRIAVPAHSPVPFSGFDKKYGGERVATFRGKFLLTGTYYFGDNDFNDSGDEHPAKYIFDPQAYIIPDDDMAVRLPHFVIRNSRQPIFISNPAAFARAMVSRSLARRVHCRSCGDATGHIAIWVDQFNAGIVCDKPDYEVRFLSGERSAKITLVPRPDRAC